MPLRGEVPEIPIAPRKEQSVIEKPKPQTHGESDDQLALSFHQVRDKVRDLNAAVSELGARLREAQREDRRRKSELAAARNVMKKLQSMKI